MIWDAILVRALVLGTLYARRVERISVHTNVFIAGGGMCREGNRVVSVRHVVNVGCMSRCTPASASSAPATTGLAASAIVGTSATAPTPTTTTKATACLERNAGYEPR